jgi:arylsulfatase A-like enzyme
MIVFGVLNFNPLKNTLIDTETDVSAASLPNIILISNDGLNAANMSVYGYERETTPFLEDLAEISLVMENNFTNANSSTGSDTALLTGKLPFETRVLYPPNTLQGSDMYEHLPGILKRYDYRTVSFAVEHYVDVNVINFKNAFDLVNGKENQYSQTSDRFSQYGYSDTIYFISTISGRILDRVQHIFLIKDMQNVFAMVTEGMESSTLNEEIIFDRLIKNLNDAQNKDQPLFAHIHLISTHGPIFTLTSQAFSAGQEQDEEWLVDFYDDAILNYDEMIREFVEHLQENGLYDNTILVFYSDHGHKWSVDNKIPLIIHFPHDQYSGSVSVATQNLDIAPTLLDYLGIEQPSWMSGESLLGGLDRNRIIYSAMVKSSFVEAGNIVEEKIGPPFYQFGYIGVIQCQRFYKINLQDLSMKTHDIVNFSDPCVESELLSAEEIWENAGGLLSSFGFILPDDW